MNLKDTRSNMTDNERKMNEALDDLIVMHLRRKDGLVFDTELADIIIKKIYKYNKLRKLEKKLQKEQWWKEEDFVKNNMSGLTK